MALKIGSITPSKLYLGSTEILKAYLGSNLVWDKTSGGFLLDTYTGASAAYSLRQLKTGATDVVRVRRDSDNSEQDFTPTEITDGTLTTFVGAGDGYVTKLYGQTGSNDATQTTSTKQGRIVISGNLQTLTSKPAIYTVGVNDFNYQNVTYNGVSNFTLFVVLAGNGAINGGAGDFMRLDTLGNFVIQVDTQNTFSGTPTGQGDSGHMLLTCIKDNSGIYVWCNGSYLGYAAQGGSYNFGGYMFVYNGFVFEFNGRVQEYIQYNSDQSSNRAAIETEINNHYNIYVSDVDAQAFITAAGITDATQKDAINTLVLGLKSDGIWSKMKAVYPMVGGTASSHKYNLIDPQDTDAAFRLDFNGGWTHSANGALPNGSNAYADTHFIENNELTIDDAHISAYLRTNINGLFCDMGAFYTFSIGTMIFPRYLDDSYLRVQGAQAGAAASSSDSRGFWVANRVSSSETRNRHNSTLITQSFTSVGLSQAPFYIGASRGNAGSPNPPRFYSNRETAFNTIGEGLTDTESSNLYTRVQAFQTSLSRNV